MKSYPLEERHRIEKEFHDQWAGEIDLDGLLVRESFEAGTAIEYKRVIEILGDLRGKNVLDLGCGPGEASVYFALKGANVSAVDLSPAMTEKARALAKKFGVQLKTFNMGVEDLNFSEGSFDVIYGSSVLHHLDVSLAVPKIVRVLKKDGVAVFIEPLDNNPVVNVYRAIAKDVRTETEKPLTRKDVDYIRTFFARVDLEHFWLMSMAVFLYMFFIERVDPNKDRYWKRVIRESRRYEKGFNVLNSWDKKILKVFPWAGRLCWTTVMILRNKH